MAVSLKKSVAAVALAIVLLASMFGWALHVNAAVPQHHSSASTSQLAHVGPNFVCPPPPFLCE